MSWFSGKKSTEVPRSGHEGDTSPEQEEVLHLFKQWIESEEIAPLDEWDDNDLLKFCIGREF